MANAFTGTAAMSNLVQTTYDRALEFALRAQPMFRQVANVLRAEGHPFGVFTPLSQGSKWPR